jgi:hypothetical protein
MGLEFRGNPHDILYGFLVAAGIAIKQAQIVSGPIEHGTQHQQSGRADCMHLRI